MDLDTKVLSRLAASWEERAAFRRKGLGDVDNAVKLMLSTTADIYDACAIELRDRITSAAETATVNRALARARRVLRG